MKFTIDEKECLKRKITPEEVLIALALRSAKSYTDTLENLILREIIVYRDGQYYITQRWNDIIDEILLDSSKEIQKTDEELLALAEKIQACFPKQKMRDRFGRETPYYYRCNKTEIKGKLKKFFARFGNYSDDDIVDAAKRYVASFKGNYTGMRLAKYFIWKDDIKPQDDGENHVEALSDLASYLENKEEEGEVVTNSDDWLMSARN